MTIELLPEERETHFNMTGDNHNEWVVFSDDPYWIRKLDKVAAGVAVGAGKEYKLRADQLLLRAGKAHRTYTDEQKAVLAERMRGLSKTKAGN